MGIISRLIKSNTSPTQGQPANNPKTNTHSSSSTKPTPSHTPTILSNQASNAKKLLITGLATLSTAAVAGTGSIATIAYLDLTGQTDLIPALGPSSQNLNHLAS